MSEVSVELRNIQGTRAAMGWAEAHTLVVDRPEGRAGGQGLGFNGAQLLALAIGGCFCNDLRYAADDLKTDLGDIEVSVRITLGGSPPVATQAEMIVRCHLKDGSPATHVIEKASAVSTVSNSLRNGFPVRIRSAV
jgi:organic hydroperoxide reductase OsmC/OhrA